MSGLPLLAHGGHSYQTANVGILGGSAIGGAATLFRSPDLVRAAISTGGLNKKAAYTVWAIVWNDPEVCVGGCGEDDIGVAGNSVFYAAGFVTGTNGTATVNFQLDAGDLADGIDVLIPGGLAAGNGEDAEIHFVIRSHGKLIPNMVADQIGSFNGACSVNTCEDQLAVAFPPL